MSGRESKKVTKEKEKEDELHPSGTSSLKRNVRDTGVGTRSRKSRLVH